MLGRIKSLGFAAVLAGLPLALPASAQEAYPTRAVQMIVPATAGGGSDIAMRVLAAAAEPILGQRILIVNRPGGGGTAGMEAITRAKPDGYTIGGIWTAPLTISPVMFDVPYTSDQYAPVSLSAAAPGVFCVRKEFPANNGNEFIAALKAAPDKYTYGTDGVGGVWHLGGEMIFHAAGVKARPIPFAGANENVATLLSGNLDIYVSTMAPILPYVRQGTVKCLLISSAERSHIMPDVQSVRDIGLKNVEANVLRGIIAPVGIPPERFAKLVRVFQAAAKDPNYIKTNEQRGEETKGTDAATFKKMIQDEAASFAVVLNDLGLAKKK